MKLIDADNLHNAKFLDTSGFGEAVAYRVGWNDAIDAICENEPTIDAVEVVRCKDCKWRKACKVFSQQQITDDSYCSWGEREGE